MKQDFIKVTPNRERAKSILKMADTTIEMIETIDYKRFTTIVTKEYYESIRELITALLLLDGLRTGGEGAHKKLIEYLADEYKKDFERHEIALLEDLRDKRNKISYEGLFVPEEYLTQRKASLDTIAQKLREIIRKKLGEC